MRTSSVPGFGRYDVTVPPAGNLSFGYSARLMPQRKVTPQDRLIAVKGEMEATLPIAQPADVDQAVAVVKNHYFGPVERTEAVETGIDGAPPTLGPVGNASLTLTGTPGCLVIGRSCHFTAQDNAPREPKLTALDPAGNVLVATVAADVPNSGFTCGGVEAPAVTVRNWTFEPTAWRLSWAGWQVTKGRYTVVTDTDVAENNRCVAAASHTVVTGLLTG
jgi:hypothetical protein